MAEPEKFLYFSNSYNHRNVETAAIQDLRILPICETL